MARLDGTKLGAATALAAGFLGAACGASGGAATTTSGGSGGTGAGNHGGHAAASTASSTSVVTAVGTGGFGGSGGSGGAAAACDPPAAAGSLWELQGLNYPDFAPVSMCKYRGDVTLIVNTAAI